MRNVPGRVVEKIKTHIFYSVTFSQYRAVYEIMWKKCGTTRQDTDGNIRPSPH
jgi:hypothetical protein